MLGDKIYEGTGKVTGQRVLSTEGGPKVETSFADAGKLLGVDATQMGTYQAIVRADGTLFGHGQGVQMGKNGEMVSWVGQGVGTFTGPGAVRFRGAVYFESASPSWARLNSVAGVYEYEADANGNTRLQTWEWK